MTVRIPFPLPSKGFAKNSKVRVNLDFIVDKFNEFNTGTATWDAVYVGTPSSAIGVITLYNATNAFYTKVQSGVATADQTYTLPVAVPASATSVLQSTTVGVLSWTAAPTFTSLQTGFVTLPNASNFDVNLKCHPDTNTDYDFYLPTTNGDVGQFLTSDGTYCVWATSPVTAGLQTRMPFYHDAGTVAKVSDHLSYAGGNLYVIPADHSAIVSDRTYTIPNAGADTSFAMQNTSAVFTGIDVTAPGYVDSSVYRISGATSGKCTINAAAVTTNHTLVLPANVGGAGTVLTDVAGNGTLSWTAPASSGAASTALDNLASVAINTSLISDTDNTDDLGDATHDWRNLYLQGAIYSGATELATAAELATLDGVTSNIQTQLGTKFPSAGGTITGDTTWSAGKNLILTDDTTNTVTIALPAAVTTYTLTLPANDGDSGQFLQTNGSGVCTWAAPSGATAALDNLAAVAINTSLVSDTDNTDDLGTSSVAWKDLFLSGSIKKGANTVLTLGAAGEVTQPLQPSFLVECTGATDVTGDGTYWTVTFNSEIFDQGSDFASNTTFTAPVSGRYFLSFSARTQGASANALVANALIKTSNRLYVLHQQKPGTTYGYSISVVADMDAGDTAQAQLEVAGGTKIVDVSAANGYTYFSGSLIN
jgi:hypothetical protein